MMEQRNKASGTGLERLCDGQDWMRSTDAGDGVECFEAWFHGKPYHRHRHDAYAICLTTIGIQAFYYRGGTEVSTPGQVVVLHPDEVHDGYAATDAGFGYRQLYVEPALIFDALQSLSPRMCSLPFVRAPVVINRTLANAVRGAFTFMGTGAGMSGDAREPLAVDSLIAQVAEGLLEADPSCAYIPRRPRHLDGAAIRRAREYLDSRKSRVVHSAELEAVTGLSRYELARQFRLMCGTSPYRYLLMRRLDAAREQLAQGCALVEVALEAGFADQAHFSRLFKATVGVTPARYRTLTVPSRALFSR